MAFNFEKLGMITVLTGLDEDSMTDAALDAGAQDLAAILVCVAILVSVFACTEGGRNNKCFKRKLSKTSAHTNRGFDNACARDVACGTM